MRDPLADGSDDPLDGVANLFDLGIVFSLGFVLALFGLAEASPAPVPEERTPSPRYQVSSEEKGGQGQRLGVAYQLPDGQVVFVPDKP